MSRGFGAVVAGIVVCGGLIGAFSSMHKIDPGYTGIIYSPNGGVEETTLGQGFHFVSPLKKVIEYSTSIETGFLSADVKEGSKDDESIKIPTSDGKTVQTDVEYSYYFDAERLPETFSKFKGKDGKQIEQEFMRAKFKTFISEVSSRFSVMDIYGDQREELNRQVFEHVSAKFDEYGIVIESVSLTNIALDKATEQAVQDRVNKQQELETAKVEAEKAAIENQKAVEKAKADAEQKEIAAQAEANSLLIEAEAQAEANKKLANSINQNLIDMEMINKWNGTVPQVQGNGGSTILDMRGGE